MEITVYFLTKTKYGLSRSRNRAIENAVGEICLLADNDIQYVPNYKQIIKQAFEKCKADIIVFYVEDKNPLRKNKKIKRGKISFLNLMKARSYEIAFRRDKIVKVGPIFDIGYGAGSVVKAGEETIFLADCYRKGLTIVSWPEKIGEVLDKESTWFKDYDADFLRTQGAVFQRYCKKYCNLLILQYAIRKHKLYKHNISFWEALRELRKGAKRKM